MSYLTILVVTIFLFKVNGQTTTQKPNIIIIMADDLGRYDVSFNNNNEMVSTPNIDALAFNGIILNRFYTHAMCTPSRGALMTGKYATRLGLQHNDIRNDYPYGLPLEEKLLPEYLKAAGYKTHLVGKWHLGFFKRDYNPMRRGFDSYYGHLGDLITYQNHEFCLPQRPFWVAGYDMRRNESIDYTSKGEHVTELYTNRAVEVINNHNVNSPLFLMITHLAPHSENWFSPFPDSKEAQENPHIINPIQRRMAGQVIKMDSHIGYTIAALENRGMLNNSVIVFLSDNGAPSIGEYYTFGSNYPLRGQKDTPFEGGIRVPAIIWSPLFNTSQYVCDRRIHITDIFTTLAVLGGANLNNINFGEDIYDIVKSWVGKDTRMYIDGLNMWDTLSYHLDGDPRKRMIHNIDKYVSYTNGDWKYIRSPKDKSCSMHDGWIGHTIQHDCLFNNHHKSTYLSDVKYSVANRILEKYSQSGKLTDTQINEMRRGTKMACNTQCINCCMPWLYPCLFNIKDDPCEHHNLFIPYFCVALQMEAEIKILQTTSEYRQDPNSDCNANPANNNYIWDWWQGY